MASGNYWGKTSFQYPWGLVVFIVIALSAITTFAENTVNEEKKIEKEQGVDQLSPVGVSGEALKELEEGTVLQKHRFTIPPYYQEKTEQYMLRLFFPIYFGKEVKGKNPEKILYF